MSISTNSTFADNFIPLRLNPVCLERRENRERFVLRAGESLVVPTISIPASSPFANFVPTGPPRLSLAEQCRNYIRDYHANHGKYPPRREVEDHFCVASKTVYQAFKQVQAELIHDR